MMTLELRNSAVTVLAPGSGLAGQRAQLTQHPLKLVIAAGAHAEDRMRALIDARVQIEGCRAEFHSLVSGEMLVRSFEDPDFKVAELSLSTYVARLERRECDYVALPVYMSRSFRHRDMYIRTDRGISRPSDLRGRRIGVAEYNHTAYVWARGLLEHEYGVRPSDVIWVSGPRESHDHYKADGFTPPPGVRIEPAPLGQCLSDMLEAGDIDAFMSPHPPSCVRRGAPNVAPLIADAASTEDEYFLRTGIFPILHVMGVRKDLAARYPWLASRLTDAFTRAKDIGLAERRARGEKPNAPPELAGEVRRMTTLMGDDFHPYGLAERERRTLDLFLRLHFEQGLSRRRFNIDELFATTVPT